MDSADALVGCDPLEPLYILGEKGIMRGGEDAG